MCGIFFEVVKYHHGYWGSATGREYEPETSGEKVLYNFHISYELPVDSFSGFIAQSRSKYQTDPKVEHWQTLDNRCQTLLTPC